MKGTVKWFNVTKGYGFISGEDGKDSFVHQSNILMNGVRALEAGQMVSYDVENCEKGLNAINVQIEA